MKVFLYNSSLHRNALGYRGAKLCVGRINRECGAMTNLYRDESLLNERVFDLLGSDSDDHFVREAVHFLVHK